jgi:hypothetical protein
MWTSSNLAPEVLLATVETVPFMREEEAITSLGGQAGRAPSEEKRGSWQSLIRLSFLEASTRRGNDPQRFTKVAILVPLASGP